MPFEIVRNDITKMRVDAIVNAANSSLLGGGGVDGAIHKAAGPELLEECRTLNGCGTGRAKITKGYRLPARYVIHTVGPIWQDGRHGEKELLASCYRESLRLAEENGCETVAFPLISSGAYGYPKEEALRTATDTILEFLADSEMHVFLVVFDRNAWLISNSLYDNIKAFIDDDYISEEYLEAQRRRRYYSEKNRVDSALPLAGFRDTEKKEQRSRKESFFRKKEKRSGEKASREEAAGEACPSAPMQPVIPDDLDKYLRMMDEGFRDMLIRKIDEKHMTDAQCYKKANIDRKLFNKIINKGDYRPGKSTVLALAVALELPLDETKEMLAKAGYALSHSSRSDMIVEYFILRREYDVFRINEALFTFDQKLLGSVMS